MQGNLASIAKDLENAQSKTEKARIKGAKVEKATSEMEVAQSQWESQAPYVFEQLQALDETRVNQLRDLLTQYLTHEADNVERNRSGSELSLNALLSIETADEIKAFAARVTSGRQSLPGRQSSTGGSTRPGTSGPPAPPPPRGTHERTLERLESNTGSDAGSPAPGKEKKPSAIKRLGTVMGRRKSAVPPPTPEKKKEKMRSSIIPFRRGNSSQNVPEETGSNLAPIRSEEEPASISRKIPPPIFERSEPRSAQRPPQQLVDTDSDAISAAPMVNGTGPSAQSQFVQSPTSSTPLQPQPLQSQPPVNAFQSVGPTVTNKQVSHELSGVPPSPVAVPPLSIDAVRQSQLDSSPAEGDELARNLTIRDQPIPEDESAAKKAMDDMANQLRMQSQPIGVSRAGGTVRGRRDVRNTMFVPSPEPPVLSIARDISPNEAPTTNNSTMAAALAAPIMAAPAVAGLASPIKQPETPIFGAEGLRGTDAQSVHSSHSLGGGTQHPDLQSPGLNASIIETVSTLFSGNGVSKSSVVGELALSYISNEAFPSGEHEMIRLENFQMLEKVAVNPTFVSGGSSAKGKEVATGSDQPGEYNIALTAIKRPSPTVAFKYQLHLNESHLSVFSPIILQPAWQIQEGQASAIMVYFLNPDFGTTTITLSNVIISVAIDTNAGETKISNAMMMPQAGASLKKKQHLVLWRLPELTVTPEHQRLLVRFITTGAIAKAGPVEAKWELNGSTGSGLSVSVLSSAARSADPFADEEVEKSPSKSWEGIACMKKLVSGRYTAM